MSGLTVGRIPAREIADEFGTPLYVYDAELVREQWRKVAAALGPRVELLYCLKANPGLAMTALLRELGSGAEVASAGEIALALAAGHAGTDLQFAGPGKSEGDLDAALDAGLVLNLESETEYDVLAERSRCRGARPGVAIRINPAEGRGGSRMAMGGGSKKFGVDVERVPALAQRIHDEDAVELLGLHVYAGTQCFDAAAWLENAAGLITEAERVESLIGRPLTTLNLGGGFGSAIFENDPSFDLEEAGRGVQELIERDARPKRRYFVELGRYLVAPAGVYLTRVRDLKESRGKLHAILDGGMHHHAAAAGLGSVIRRAYPIVCCEDRGGERRKVTLGGPLCTPADELARDTELPELRRGDVLAILQSGAYGLSFSNTLFLSHPTPAEVLVDGGRAVLVRERGRPEDVLRGQRIAPDRDRGG